MQIKDIENAFMFALNYVKAKAPKDTGNLAYNAIKYRFVGNTFEVFVDEEVAPYMVYTNEKWKSGKNPNEGWWNETIEDIMRTMAIYLKGELTKE